MTMISVGILALAFLAFLVATLEHLDTRARERRWRDALSSMQIDDGRTPMTDPVTIRRQRGEHGVSSCQRLGS